MEEGRAIFQPQSPSLKHTLDRTTIVSYRLSHPLPPPLELPRHGHELSSVLGRSQNLWLLHLQDALGYHPFDAFEGETGSILGLCVHHKRFTYSCDNFRHSMVNMAGHIFLRECKISPGRSLNRGIETHTICGCRVNIVEGKPCDRQMTTGNHTVRDIYCIKCGVTLGWKYVSVSVPTYTSWPERRLIQ